MLGLFDGKFTEAEARHGGRTEYAMGRTAVVELPGGQTVMLTTDRVAPFSLGQLTSCGLDPTKFKAIVAKGVHAPVAAYKSVCPTMIRVNTPGIATADTHEARLPAPPPAAVSAGSDLAAPHVAGIYRGWHGPSLSEGRG